MQDGRFRDARSHRESPRPQDAKRGFSTDLADAMLLEQTRQGCPAQARRFRRRRRHQPQLQDPLGGDVVGEFEQLRIVTPQLLTHTIAQAYALLLQLRRQPRPLAQLNHLGITDLHWPEQLRIGAQPGRRDPGVAVGHPWRQQR